MEEKIVINWKTPSNVKIKDVVSKLNEEKRRYFVNNFIEVAEGKKPKIKEKEAKKWLDENCKDMIEWENYPKGTKIRKSAVQEMLDWFK